MSLLNSCLRIDEMTGPSMALGSQILSKCCSQVENWACAHEGLVHLYLGGPYGGQPQRLRHFICNLQMPAPWLLLG
jgi:hypothetical protein